MDTIAPRKKRVLFICGSNAARSQMAEGYLRARYGDRYDAFSAGLRSSTVSPLAIEAMSEIGIDISGQRSKDLGAFKEQHMDMVVTLCESGTGTCPIYPWSSEVLHAPVPDPSEVKGTREERLNAFRKARDSIIAWIEGNLAER